MTPEKRIEEVLQQHAFVVDPSSRDQPLRCMCQEGRCDSNHDMLQMAVDEHAAHVAAEVVQALGLKQESNTYEKLEVLAIGGGVGAFANGGQAIHSLGWRTSTRLVSEWVEQ